MKKSLTPAMMILESMMEAASSSSTRAMVDFIVAPAQTQLPEIVAALLPLVKSPLPAPQAVQAWLKCKDVVFSRWVLSFNYSAIKQQLVETAEITI